MQQTELKHFFALLKACPDLLPVRRYDPVPIIRAVNALQPLGKNTALEVLSNFAQAQDGWRNSGLCAVMRVLFDVPEPPGYMPPLVIGVLNPIPPKDMRIVPRYPLVLFHDIPLLMISSFFAVGTRASIAYQDIEFFKQKGMLRNSILRPPHNPRPFLEELKSSDQWLYNRKYNLYASEEQAKASEDSGTKSIVSQFKMVESMFSRGKYNATG